MSTINRNDNWPIVDVDVLSDVRLFVIGMEELLIVWIASQRHEDRCLRLVELLGG